MCHIHKMEAVRKEYIASSVMSKHLVRMFATRDVKIQVGECKAEKHVVTRCNSLLLILHFNLVKHVQDM